MFGRLLLLLTVIPFVELYFLIQLSDSFGFGNTVLLILVTGVLGAWMLRQQGHSVLLELRQQGTQGQLPTDAIAKGMFTFVGGVLLLTPGVLTDALGLSLIFPLTQILWKRFFLRAWQRGVQSGQVHVYTARDFRSSQQSHSDPFAELRQRRQRDPGVIDVEVQSSSTTVKNEDN
jgi:UPF0716 protein FxsA